MSSLGLAPTKIQGVHMIICVSVNEFVTEEDSASVVLSGTHFPSRFLGGSIAGSCKYRMADSRPLQALQVLRDRSQTYADSHGRFQTTNFRFVCMPASVISSDNGRVKALSVSPRAGVQGSPLAS